MATAYGVNTEGMTLDELVERADPEKFAASKSELYKFIMKRLAIGRDTLDTRLADIRERLGKQEARQG